MDPLDFERKHQPLLPRARFLSRLGRNTVVAFVVIVVALAVGMWGYMGFEGMGFVDGFLNAAMILSGMGPVVPLQTVGGKVFAGFYAIFSGLLIFAVAGLILAPVYHRMIHRFHLEQDEAPAKKPTPRRKSS
jgi:hypothetical protein